MKAKKKVIPSSQKDKLILALLLDDAVGKINRVLRTRHASLTVDFSKGHTPVLTLARPGIEPAVIMRLDYRSRRCTHVPPYDPDLLAIYQDLHNSLGDLDTYLMLTSAVPFTGPRIVKLQLFARGANRFAVTLSEAPRGKQETTIAFQLPDGTTP